MTKDIEPEPDVALTPAFHLWEIKHPYHGPDSNYFANSYQDEQYHSAFESWAEFVEDGGWADADLDYNHLYRWDWLRAQRGDYVFASSTPERQKAGEEEFQEELAEGDILHLYWVLQRKGALGFSQIRVHEADEQVVRDWLSIRATALREMWEPFL